MLCILKQNQHYGPTDSLVPFKTHSFMNTFPISNNMASKMFYINLNVYIDIWLDRYIHVNTVVVKCHYT